MIEARSTIKVDLDNSTKEGNYRQWTDGVKRKLVPEAVAGFLALHSAGLQIDIATEQTPTEVLPFLKMVTQIGLGHENYGELFNGVLVAEGGSVVQRRNCHTGESMWQVVAPKESQVERARVLDWLSHSIASGDIGDNWGVLDSVDPQEGTYVKLPTEDKQGVASISLWEKGPLITQQPEYLAKYALVERRIQQALQDLNVTHLMTYEAGNGTLRIVPKGINKAKTLGLLHAFGAVDLSSTQYVCDGPNDVALARKIVGYNGLVVAVSNAVSELHDLAAFSATQPEGLGFAEFVHHLYPDLYTDHLQSLKDRGAWIQ